LIFDRPSDYQGTSMTIARCAAASCAGLSMRCGVPNTP
jgi:hypothetical protein